MLTALRLEGHERSLLQSTGPRRMSQVRDGGEEHLAADEAGVLLRVERLEPDHAEVDVLR